MQGAEEARRPLLGDDRPRAGAGARASVGRRLTADTGLPVSALPADRNGGGRSSGTARTGTRGMPGALTSVHRASKQQQACRGGQ